MNRNEIIGSMIGKTLGYGVQCMICTEIGMNPRTYILIKRATKYGVRLIKYTSKNYARIDFKTETIFSDSIDASFFAD